MLHTIVLHWECIKRNTHTLLLHNRFLFICSSESFPYSAFIERIFPKIGKFCSVDESDWDERVKLFCWIQCASKTCKALNARANRTQLDSQKKPSNIYCIPKEYISGWIWIAGLVVVRKNESWQHILRVSPGQALPSSAAAALPFCFCVWKNIFVKIGWCSWKKWRWKKITVKQN